MIKPTSIIALHIFFFIGNIDSMVASIEHTREALRATLVALSAEAKSLATSKRIPAFAGLFVCVAVLSVMVYVFCAYAPAAAKKFPAPIVHLVLRVIAFLLICIGAQIAWRGLHSLLLAARS